MWTNSWMCFYHVRELRPPPPHQLVTVSLRGFCTSFQTSYLTPKGSSRKRGGDMEKEEKWLGFKFFSESSSKDVYICLYNFRVFPFTTPHPHISHDNKLKGYLWCCKAEHRGPLSTLGDCADCTECTVVFTCPHVCVWTAVANIPLQYYNSTVTVLQYSTTRALLLFGGPYMHPLKCYFMWGCSRTNNDLWCASNICTSICASSFQIWSVTFTQRKVTTDSKRKRKNLKIVQTNIEDVKTDYTIAYSFSKKIIQRVWYPFCYFLKKE